jgi:hypothetical protein
MKQMRVDPDGTLHCPVCNGSQFAFKRTGKAKVMGGLAVGVGALAAPKRAHCLGCGADLKPYKPSPQEVRARTKAQPPEWSPENVDVAKNPMLAPTVGEALAIRKARKAAKNAAKANKAPSDEA